MGEVSRFAEHILAEICEDANLIDKKLVLADAYEKMCAIHRLPKAIIQQSLLELSYAGFIQINWHSPTPYIKVRKKNDRPTDSRKVS